MSGSTRNDNTEDEIGGLDHFSLNSPPPLPPKPKKFSSSRSRNAFRHNQNHPIPAGTSLRPPMASPEIVEGGAAGQVSKRKLTINMPITSSSASPSSSSYPYNPDVSAGASMCKSPKIVTPGQTRIWAPVICTICMDDLFSYQESESDSNSRSFNFTKTSADTALNGNGNFAQNIPGPETLRPTVSTRCGHLFHTECINKWFMGNKEKEIKECQFCKREMMANDTTRMFPIFEDL